MKLQRHIAAAALLVGVIGVAPSAHATEASPVGVDALVAYEIGAAPLFGVLRGRYGPDRIFDETLRKRTSFQSSPLLTLAEREALRAALTDQ
ncbi:MAG: hypothetical protein AAF909_02600 [Pseudomonadota bacterium]